MTGPEVSIPAFRPFYLHLAPRGTVEDALRERISAVTAPERVEEMLDGIWATLVLTVEEGSFRMLIGEFHAFREERGMPFSTESDTALREFERHLADPAVCRRILDTYPVYERRFTTVLRNMTEAWAEMFTAFAEDRAELRAAGLLSGPGPAGEARIARATATGSDAHNDNRQVLIVELTDGTRLAFKPRALEADRFVRDLYAAAGPYLTHSLEQCIPRSVTVGSHGWQEFAVAGAMTEPEQVERYFYRFGALCALFSAIGACDLHHENLTARGEHPCLLDTETMLRADIAPPEPSFLSTLTNQFKLSVVHTMLLPVANPQSHFDVDLSGASVTPTESAKLKRPVVLDRESDGIGVSWEPVLIEQSDNVPRLGEARLSAGDHFEAMAAGCADALAFVRSDAVDKILDAHAGFPVRTVLRPTMVYGRFLDAATHPSYLADQAEADRLLRILAKSPDTVPPAASAFVMEQERAALGTGNVPLFLARSDAVELATHHARFPGFFEMPSADAARLGVALNGARSDRYHRFLLEECLSELFGDDRPAGLSAHGVFGGDALDAVRPGGWWRGIARTLDDLSVVHEGPDGAVSGWIGGIGPDRGVPTVCAGEFVSFHDFGGIATFLTRAAGHDAGLRPAADAAERGLGELLGFREAFLMDTAESVFTGASSRLLTRPGELDAAWLERILERTAERDASGDLVTDLANGPAGPLMVLLSHRERGGAEPPLGSGRLGALADLALAHRDVPRTEAWYDVAHGGLGLHWAAARAGRVLGVPSAAEEAADWLLARWKDGEETPHHGWCKGAAGELLAAAEILTTAGRRDQLTGGRLEALVARATRLPADRPVDLSVCHGSSGVVQSLIAAAGLLGEPALLERARAYQEDVLGTARTRGFFTGARGRSSLLGYMLGWAGVGDTDLLLHAATEQGVPALPVPVALTVEG
ncbi:hypothetical protein GCM10009801_26310 [Streptomyces albiaxialis]|uniref:Lantibiotic biosynthesis protein dehydration domain-containing protein n=1 Tax=Streptomyces albiaxialis TaxID=329523 RepID=A0ABN2VUU7_9ACTN